MIVKRLIAHNYPLTGASDHGISHAIYLDDPDGNGVELYWDRPREQWPKKSDGSVNIFTRRLDLNDLLQEVKSEFVLLKKVKRFFIVEQFGLGKLLGN